VANQEQLSILRQGAKIWNGWRIQHPQTRIDLSYADLDYTKLVHTDLNSANLRNAKLIVADLNSANLSGAKLINADLNGADLSGANLREANLRNANLNATNLIGTNLSGADLSSANLSNAYLGWTSFGDRDLRMIKGLHTVQHKGPSPLSINTIYLSKGEIPENFLEGIGAPDVFIEYVRSLTNKPIEYYTCFISYSSKDELFAKRLHNDLQQEGVRCWFAPEDMEIGDRVKERIDESIRLYDKLLLILSEHSIASNWVAYEVERALNKEPKGIPNVLYPVRVDQTILTCTTDWASNIQATRYVGDFENWTDPQQYEASFKRLLRALSAKKKQ
jgi:uncharacterized protein YbdZ (MbtH family)